MTKNEFRTLFLRALDVAADTAERKLAEPIPRTFLIELHAPGSAGSIVRVDDALDRIYLGSGRLYRIIDVAVRKLLPEHTVIFVRASGHAPVEFDQTWDATDLGPFKQMQAEHLEDHRVHSD
jgi:hypothetical protein